MVYIKIFSALRVKHLGLPAQSCMKSCLKDVQLLAEEYQTYWCLYQAPPAPRITPNLSYKNMFHIIVK